MEEELSRNRTPPAAGPSPDEQPKAADEAREEADEELADLLLCLGQEEEKVRRLSQRLQLLGEDVGMLLEGVGGEGDA